MQVIQRWRDIVALLQTFDGELDPSSMIFITGCTTTSADYCCLVYGRNGDWPSDYKAPFKLELGSRNGSPLWVAQSNSEDCVVSVNVDGMAHLELHPRARTLLSELTVRFLFTLIVICCLSSKFFLICVLAIMLACAWKRIRNMRDETEHILFVRYFRVQERGARTETKWSENPRLMSYRPLFDFVFEATAADFVIASDRDLWSWINRGAEGTTTEMLLDNCARLCPIEIEEMPPHSMNTLAAPSRTSREQANQDIVREFLFDDEWKCMPRCTCKARFMLNTFKLATWEDEFSNVDNLAIRLRDRVGLKQEDPSLSIISSSTKEQQARFAELVYTVIQCSKPEFVTGLHSRIRSISRRIHEVPMSLFLSGPMTRIGEYPYAGGGFADVYRGIYKGGEVAIKALRLFTRMDPQSQKVLRKECCREALIWRRVDHPFILPLLGVMDYEDRLCLVTPWMHYGDLRSYSKQYPDKDLLPLMRQVAEGVRHLHSRHLIHGDLKGSNVLLENDDKALLTDLGLSITSSSYAYRSSTHFDGGGTIRWMAPESLAVPPEITYKSDTYSFGMTLYEVIMRQDPFESVRQPFTLISLILEGTRPDTRTVDPGVRDLLNHCWASAANERGTMDQLIAKMNDIGYQL